MLGSALCEALALPLRPMGGDGKVDERVSIYLGSLLPTVFDLKLTCQEDSFQIKWRIQEVERVKKSVWRQIQAACKVWADRTDHKVTVQVKNDDLVVTDRPIQFINKRCHVKEPSVAALIGEELYGKATCFMVWVPFPDCVFQGLGGPSPRTGHDYMWIPTTESMELHDLEHKEPRDAARHELKHWLKERMKTIGVRGIPSPDKDKKKQYWPKLMEALTAENIANLNKEIAERKKKRERSAAPLDEPGPVQ